MSSSVFVILPIVILIILLLVAIPALLGVFVYRDARARDMEPLLWTLIAVFAPGFIGLIMYLVMRRDKIKMSCPKCGTEVQQGFVSCPTCGQKLSASCSHCGTALRPEWKLCPQCGSEITEAGQFASPVVNKPDNKGFAVAIAAIMAIPLALIAVIAVLGIIFYSPGNREYSEEAVVISPDDYEDMARSEFSLASGYKKVYVIPADENTLTKTEMDWVRAKQAGKKGIYALTFLRNSSDGINSSYGKGMYKMVTAFTVVVVNPPDGRKYDLLDSVNASDFFKVDPDASDTWDEEISIADSIIVRLTDKLTVDETSETYNNVFVIVHPVQFEIEFDFSESDHQTAVVEELSSDNLTVMLTNDAYSYDGDSYTIPYNDEEEFYTAFNK